MLYLKLKPFSSSNIINVNLVLALLDSKLDATLICLVYHSANKQAWVCLGSQILVALNLHVAKDTHDLEGRSTQSSLCKKDDASDIDPDVLLTATAHASTQGCVHVLVYHTFLLLNCLRDHVEDLHHPRSKSTHDAPDMDICHCLPRCDIVEEAVDDLVVGLGLVRFRVTLRAVAGASSSVAGHFVLGMRPFSGTTHDYVFRETSKTKSIHAKLNPFTPYNSQNAVSSSLCRSAALVQVQHHQQRGVCRRYVRNPLHHYRGRGARRGEAQVQVQGQGQAGACTRGRGCTGSSRGQEGGSQAEGCRDACAQQGGQGGCCQGGAGTG